MWLLKQPRDAMTTFMFAGMIAGAVLGILIAHPTNEPAHVHRFPQRKPGRPVPDPVRHRGLRRGFRLPQPVSSSTSSKTVENEKDMLKVGYGAMVTESLLAILALCVAGAAGCGGRHPPPPVPRSRSSLPASPASSRCSGVPVYVAQCFMTMCVSALALTSLDAVSRIGRMSWQEMFSVMICRTPPPGASSCATPMFPPSSR